MRFTKAHGLGNDFVILDALQDPSILVRDLHGFARVACDRRTGVGADQLLTIEPPTCAGAAVRMRVFNADGSEAEMCGNGIRCVARLFASRDAGFRVFLVETKGGLLRCEALEDGSVRVGMGAPRFGAEATGLAGALATMVSGDPASVELHGHRGVLVSVGNPHFVAFLDAPPDERLVERDGPTIERHEAFALGVNAQFAFVESRERVVLRTWERGAGMTSACGTGACATFAAGHAMGVLDETATVRLPGGELRFERTPQGEVQMTGPATIVFEGEWLGG